MGHSERRARFGETTESLVPAIIRSLEEGLIPVLCVGETLEQREACVAEKTVANQLRPLFDVSLDLSELVIAYEPVWAIGTGRSAKRCDIDYMHQTIRSTLDIDDALILYGGSVSPESAKDVFGSPEVSGALVGGASIDEKKFAAIVAAWESR